MPSPDQREYAALLLRKANEDLAVVRALIDNAEIADDVIGFHAQQTIEKALKAVLVLHSVEFPLDRVESLQSAEGAIEWARSVVEGP